jgi:hypothetical protein
LQQNHHLEHQFQSLLIKADMAQHQYKVQRFKLRLDLQSQASQQSSSQYNHLVQKALATLLESQ